MKEELVEWENEEKENLDIDEIREKSTKEKVWPFILFTYW